MCRNICQVSKQNKNRHSKIDASRLASKKEETRKICPDRRSYLAPSAHQHEVDGGPVERTRGKGRMYVVRCDIKTATEAS
jgi:hypothetical protein